MVIRDAEAAVPPPSVSSSPPSSSSIPARRAYSRFRRRSKKEQYCLLAPACAIFALGSLLVCYNGGRFAIAGRDSQDTLNSIDAIQERNLRNEEGDSYDGSAAFHPSSGARDCHDGCDEESASTPISATMPNCTLPSIDSFPVVLFTKEERQDGAVIINVLVMAYMFAALGIVCDDYFMPSLEIMADVLNLSEDVAGASFMAIGGSAPELFSSLIAVFITHDDIGIGTIVGSALFNILCVIGLCGILAGQVIRLTCWPLLRDSVCYIGSIAALALVVEDGVVTWKDSVVLLSMYVLYCLLMFFNPPIEKLVAAITPSCCIAAPDDQATLLSSTDGKITNGNEHSEMTRLMSESEESSAANSPVRAKSTKKKNNGAVANGDTVPNGVVYGGTDIIKGVTVEEKGIQVELIGTRRRTARSDSDSDTNSDGDGNDKHHEPASPFELPEKGFGRYARMLAFPIILAFYVTIPDCRKKKWERCFLMTFLLGLVWIGTLTYLLVWMVTVIGDTLDIPDTIMGLTLLAAGASTPDTILSIIAARTGYGDMAISHSLGSNLFDILVGLGLPWFIQTVLVDRGSTVIVYSGAILYITLLLLASVIIAIVLINAYRLRLGKTLGVALLICYVLFVVVAILFEMNLIIPGLSLPPCG